MTAFRVDDRCAAEIAHHEARLSHLGSTLYTLESSLDLSFVRARARAGGGPGHPACEVEAALAQVWVQYPLARDHVQRLVGAAAAGRRREVQHLLGGDAITMPAGGSVSVGRLLDLLQRQVDEVGERAAELAECARQALLLLDSSTAAVVALLERAKAVGADHDVEVTEAQRELDRAVAVVADGGAVDPEGRLPAAIDAARTRLELLERQWETLPAQLVGARAQLEEIRRLIRSGADAWAEARQKISEPADLCEPLDPSGLECSDRGLQPWLARIEDQATSGRWPAAAASVEQWQKLAQRWLAGAHHVLGADSAPLLHRNELRGLVQAWQARAAASGRAEEPRLIDLGSAAEDSLYVAPCDLVVAEARVHAYIAALRNNPPGDGA